MTDSQNKNSAQIPLVSVLMTTYNHAPYIVQAMDSVLVQQTSFRVELVVSDDCSTDGTTEICRQYAAQHADCVRLLESEHNVGWRANYRRTLDACRGRYVAYCDGDDWWSDPYKLQMQVRLMESNPDCGMCYTYTTNYFQETGRSEPDHANHYTDFQHLVRQLTICNCSTLARRDLVLAYYAEIHPENRPEWHTDDVPMWLWFAACSRISYLPAKTTVYRRLTKSVSRSDDYQGRIIFCDSLKEISLWFDAHYDSGRSRFRILRYRNAIVWWMLSYNGSAGEYLARWWHDVRNCPRLLLSLEGPGLFVKKIFLRRKYWKK